jgi:hypothetical protein
MKILEKPKVKIKNEDEEKLEFMIVNKTPLHNIIKSYELYNEINDVVYKVNKIIILASQFLNLYLIYLFDNNLDFPNIDKQFILTIFSVITKKNDGRGKKPSEDTLIVIKNLENFYNRYYKQCITDDDIIKIDKLSFVLAYEAIDIVKNIKNNITEHFQDYVNKFVNQSFEVKFLIQDINNLDYDIEKKKEIKNSIYTDLRKVKKDLLRTDNKFESDEMFHNWIKIHKPFILRKNKLSKNSIDYDLCVSPLDYIKSLFYTIINCSNISLGGFVQ